MINFASINDKNPQSKRQNYIERLTNNKGSIAFLVCL